MRLRNDFCACRSVQQHQCPTHGIPGFRVGVEKHSGACWDQLEQKLDCSCGLDMCARYGCTGTPSVRLDVEGTTRLFCADDAYRWRLLNQLGEVLTGVEQ